MRILVTGGAGYIGSHACKALALAGHEPVAYDDLRTGHHWAVRWGPLVVGDVGDGELMRRTLADHRIDVVMHFAALSNVGESARRPDRYYRTNVCGTLALLDAMRAAGVERLVFSSTCAVYGMSPEMPLTEATPQRPVSVYGRSKQMAETVIADHAETFGLGAIALRYFNAAGADPDGELGEEHDPETHLIPLVLQAAAGERDNIAIFGSDYDTPDGTCIRDYVHVADIAEAHVKALDAIEAGRMRAFNLGSERGSSVLEVLDAARRVTGREIASVLAPRRTGDAPVLLASAAAARSVLGWTPRHEDLEGMIASAWAWHTVHRHRHVAAAAS